MTLKKQLMSCRKILLQTWALGHSRTKYFFDLRKNSEKVYFRSQILERPSIGEYWNISGVPVLPENVIFTFFRTCWCYSEAYNTGTQKWSSIAQYSCNSQYLGLEVKFFRIFLRTAHIT